MNETRKAQKYESIRPGVQVSESQKAERFDRMTIKEKYKGLPRRPRIHQNIAVISGGSCWCDCGLFKNHKGDCK